MTWRTIPAWPSYEISKSGVVRRRLASLRGHPAGMLLKEQTDKYGYTVVMLQEGSVRRLVKRHRLVLETFVGPAPSNNHDGAHWNRKRSDNRLENLRWALPTENSADMVRHRTNPKGERNPRAKLTVRDVRKIRRLAAQGKRHKAIGDLFGMSRLYIWNVVHGVTWGHVS